MEEGKGGGGESARASSSFVSVGGRQRFTVELRPGETTIVSWKKLVKDATKVAVPISVPEPPADAHLALEARLAPVRPSSIVPISKLSVFSKYTPKNHLRAHLCLCI